MVDGADQPVPLYESNAFNEVAPNVILSHHTMSASEVVVSDASWARAFKGTAGCHYGGRKGNQPVRKKSFQKKKKSESIARLKEKVLNLQK